MEHIEQNKETRENLTIFLSGLHGETQEAMLTDYFSQVGEIIKVKLKMIKDNKVCAGYGFMECADSVSFDRIIGKCEFSFEETTIKCVENLKGITLNLYKEELEKRKVYVIGVPKSLKDDQLRTVFGQVGEVERAYTIKKGRKKQSKHFAFVIYRDVESAEKAIEKKKFKFKKFKLTCKRFESKSNKVKKSKKKQKETKNEEKKIITPKKEGILDLVTYDVLNLDPQPHNLKIAPQNKTEDQTGTKKPRKNFNLDLLRDFTDFPDEPNIHTPPPEEDSISQRSSGENSSLPVNLFDEETNGQDENIEQQHGPLSVYTKCCINYIRPPTPEESIISENDGSGNVNSENQEQNLARVFLDGEFFEKSLRVGELLQDPVSLKVRNENHRFSNVRVNRGGRKQYERS